MSIKVSITDPGGRTYEIEAPINSVAATDSKTPYWGTQQMLTNYTARVVSAVIGQHRKSCGLPYDPNIDPDIHSSRRRQIEYSSIDKRTLDSCYVERVGRKAKAADDEIRVVVISANRFAKSQKAIYRYKLKKFAPLRRVLNAYTAEIGRDRAHYELSYKGDRIYYDDTAEDLGMKNGDTLKAHHHPPNDDMSPVFKAVKAVKTEEKA